MCIRDSATSIHDSAGFTHHHHFHLVNRSKAGKARETFAPLPWTVNSSGVLTPISLITARDRLTPGIRPSSDEQKVNRTFQFLDIRGHSFYCNGCPPMGEIIGSRQQARTARTHLGRRFAQRFGPAPFQCWGRAHRCHVYVWWPNSLKRGDARVAIGMARSCIIALVTRLFLP